MKCTGFIIATLAFLVGCGKVNEVVNDQKLQGRWLRTESEHGNVVDKVLDKDSVVLTFKDGTLAYSRADSVKGLGAYNAIPECLRGPRQYKVENETLILVASGNCPEKRSHIEKVDAQTLKFIDPENTDTTRTFSKINEERFRALVKPSDRRL